MEARPRFLGFRPWWSAAGHLGAPAARVGYAASREPRAMRRAMGRDLVTRGGRESALLRTALSRWHLRGCEVVGDDPAVSGRVWIRGGGRIRIGRRVVIDASAAPVELFAHPGAEIALGDDVRIGPGASLEALGRVTVGNRVELGPFCKVLDSHYHPLQGDRLNRPPPIPVVIEDDVVLGREVILLPGAHVTAGTRVAPGAVVSRRGRAPPAQPAVRVETVTPASLHRLAAHRAVQVVQLSRAWLLFGRPAVGKRIFCGRGVRVSNAGKLSLGNGILFFGGPLPTDVVCGPDATLDIGPGGKVGPGTRLDAAVSVVIGARCLIGSRVRVVDHDERGRMPIVVGDDVWLAHGAVVAPGVTIGHRAVIGAGSVVTHDVPDDHLALGNPAKALPLALVNRGG